MVIVMKNRSVKRSTVGGSGGGADGGRGVIFTRSMHGDDGAALLLKESHKKKTKAQVAADVTRKLAKVVRYLHALILLHIYRFTNLRPTCNFFCVRARYVQILLVVL